MDKKIKKLRENEKLTQEQLANKIGVKRATVSIYENGGAYPTAEHLKIICEIFSISADYLLGLSNSPNVDRNDLTDKQTLLFRELSEEVAMLNNQIRNLKE